MARMRDLEDGTYDYDDEMDSSPQSSGNRKDPLSLTSSSASSSGMRKRGNGKEELNQYARSSNRVLSDLEKIGVKPGVGVSKAVTFIDSWTMLLGR